MDSKELRVGNLLIGFRPEAQKEPVEFKVISIEPEGVNNPVMGYLWDEIKPIPLTEDWLIKFGLSWLVRGERYRIINDIQIELERKFVLIETTIIARCQYVHQLQNLYFALTGEELTIK